MQKNAVAKIAVLQAKGLGDFIVTLPALSALKEAFPQAELVFLGRPWHRELVESFRVPIDRAVIVPPLSGITVKEGEPEAAAEDLENFFSGMLNESFDLAVHFQGDGRSANPFLKKLEAKVTAGMANSGAQPLDFSIPYVHYQSEVLRFLEIVSLVGGKTANIEPKVSVKLPDPVAAELLQTIPKPFAVLHPGALDLRRMWPKEKFVELGRKLTGQGYDVVVTGSEEEQGLAAEICVGIGTQAHNASTELSLAGLAQILREAAVVVCGDTGPLHLARAVGAKTVGIYWLPNVINWAPLTRQKHRLAIDFNLECPMCGIKPVDPWPFEPQTENCHHEVSFVRNVGVEEVFAHVKDLLGPG